MWRTNPSIRLQMWRATPAPQAPDVCGRSYPMGGHPPDGLLLPHLSDFFPSCSKPFTIDCCSSPDFGQQLALRNAC